MSEQNAAIASNLPCKLTLQTCRRVQGGLFFKGDSSLSLVPITCGEPEGSEHLAPSDVCAYMRGKIRARRLFYEKGNLLRNIVSIFFTMTLPCISDFFFILSKLSLML